MILIANRPVNIGDDLYHIGKRRWGKIVRFDTNAAVLRITADGDEMNYVERHITTGGFDNGVRMAYWHAPLNIDLPYRDLSKVERILTFLLQELS